MKTLGFLLVAALSVAALPTALAQAPVPLPEVCVPIYDFPDNGLAVCVDPDGKCLVFLRRTTFIGPIDTCIVPNPL